MKNSFFINFETPRAVHCTDSFIHMKGMNPHLTRVQCSIPSQNFQSTISSDPVTIELGRQSFEITTDPITEPIGDGGCEEGQTAILNFVQFIEPVLTVQTKGGNIVTHTFPSVP